MFLKLKAEPDAMGFFYGHAGHDDDLVSVNVLPPLSERLHWSGKIRSSNIVPDDRKWTVFVNGEEIGRVPASSDIYELVNAHLATGA